MYSDDPLNDSLGRITLTGASGRNIKFVIGRPGIDFAPFSDPGQGALYSWCGGIQENGAIVSVQASVFGHLCDLNVTRVARLRVGGSIIGDVGSSGTESVFIIQVAGDFAPSLLDATPVISANGPITSVLIAGDMIEADIIAGGSQGIGSVVVDGNIVGASASDPARVWSKAGIGTVRAGTMLDVSIDADTDRTSGGSLGVLETTTQTAGLGYYIGDVYANDLDLSSGAGSIIIAGSCVGNIELASAVGNNDVFRIGGSFGIATLDPSTIRLPASGLVGQIVFNQRDIGGNWATNASIDIGSSLTLGSADYTQSASLLGGGSAGLVPFTLHDESSSPVNGANVSIYGMFPDQLELECISRPFTKATLRMYGPVELHDSAPYFDVRRYEPGMGFVTVSFDYTSSIKSGTGNREVEIVKTSGGSAWPLGDYQIVPFSGKVRCLGAADSPDVHGFVYEFSLIETCELGLLMMYDLNHDDTVCMQDVAEWMNSPCDFNDDSVADGVDLGAIMSVATNWAY